MNIPVPTEEEIVAAEQKTVTIGLSSAFHRQADRTYVPSLTPPSFTRVRTFIVCAAVRLLLVRLSNSLGTSVG